MTAIGADGDPIQLRLVEDRAGDVRLTREAFRSAGRSVILHVASDGVEARALSTREDNHARVPRPDLILLHLNLGRMGGRERLARINEDDFVKTIPTVILAPSDSEADSATRCPHANCNIPELVMLKPFETLAESITSIWLATVKLPPRAQGD